MKNRLFSALLMLTVGALGLALLGSGYAHAAEPASPAARYQAECGACHLAYPPKLLPADTWTRVMGGLDKHFGDNAELDGTTRETLIRYLTDNARRTRRPVAASAPLRITEQRWFLHEHREIPKRMVTGNPQVRSFSNCAACHGRAAQGRFSEHGVHIPGYAGWED